MTVLNAAELAAFAVDAYDAGTELIQGLPPGFTRLDLPAAVDADFSGAAYFNAATGELVVAYRGSESLRSLFTNFSFVASTASDSALNRALQFLEDARAAVASAYDVAVVDSAITLTGHGVGGGFASLVSVASGIAATTFNGTRIGALISAMEERFGTLDPDYARRIVNYVLDGEDVTTMPRGAEHIGLVDDVAASDLTFFGQLSTELGGQTVGGAVLDSIYDWLASDSVDRQRAQRTLMALELQLGVQQTAVQLDATREQMLTEQLNKLMQTSYAEEVRTRSFDRLMVDGSDLGRVQEAGATNTLLVGASGADRLQGNVGADALFGGDGNDIIAGGGGDDFLAGGAGADLYFVDSGRTGRAVLRDAVGANRLVVDGRVAAPFFIQDDTGAYTSADGRLTLDASGTPTVTAGGAALQLEDGTFEQLGWQLQAARIAPVAATTLRGDLDPYALQDAIEGDVRANAILGGAGEDLLVGYGGADTIDGGAGSDYIRGDGDGSVGADRLIGGEDSDVLLGDAGDDVLFANREGLVTELIAGSAVGTSARGDWLAGGDGADWLFGGDARDVLSGGAGRDLLAGGAGDDTLYGDGDYEPESFEWTVDVLADGRTSLSTGASPQSNDPAGSGGDLLYGGAGNDRLYGGRGDDVLFGDAGDDYVVGQAGADALTGGDGSDTMFGGEGRQGDLSDRGDDYLAGGEGADILYASAGNNLLFGNGGDDRITAGAGDDYVDGGDGNDRIWLQGADVAYGGAGNDVITTFSTAAVFIDGGDGDDALSGDDGDDEIVGGAGADLLVGAAGDDRLMGGEGDDTYRFELGDGVDTLLDTGGADTIELVSHSPGALTRDRIRLVADESEIWLAYGDEGDRIRLGVDPAGTIETVALRTVNGAAETLESWSLASMRVTLEGVDSSEALFAVMNFENAISGGGGRDVLFGGNRDDVLDGGAGDDLLKGGEGADRYVIGAANGVDTVRDDGAYGLDVIDFAASAADATLGLADGALFIDLGGGNGVKVMGFQANDALNTVAIENFRFADGTLDAGALLARGFDIVGSDRAQTLTGTSVSDRFAARSGNEKLVGGRGNDTYTFSRGFGRDMVIDQDATSGNFDEVVFTDIDEADIVATASGDRLVFSVKDSGDVLEVQWVPTEGAQIERIRFANSAWELAALRGYMQGNDAPGVKQYIVDQMAREDAPFQFAVPAGTFVDPDGTGSLVLSASLADGSALPTWLRFENGVFSGTPGNADVGVVSVRVTARDAQGASAFDDFEIAVENENDAPVVAAPFADLVAVEDEAFSFTLPAGTFADIDAGDVLRYVVSLEKGGALPAWLRFDEATGTLYGTPGNGDVGALVLNVMAIDSAGASAQDLVEILIANENDAPELAAPLADVSGREGHLLEVEIPEGMFTDIDRGDLLTLSAALADGTALPPWLVYDADAGVLRGAPTRADIGRYNVRLTATDSEGATAFDEFVLTVEAVPGVTLVGGAGSDWLVGDAGDDVLAGRQGSDVLIGGAGDDRFDYFRDAVWGDGDRRTNLGSPDAGGTFETASIARRSRSYDVFVGGDGRDTLRAGSSSDAILLDDMLSPAGLSGARIQSVEVILAGGGNDVVDLTSPVFSLGDVRVEGGSGNDVIWASGGDDILLGGSGADRIFGGGGNDYLAGEGGGDDLNGGLGDDVLQGDAGNDRLLDGAGANVLDGRGGADELVDGAGNAFLVGGRSGDRITLGGGNDVIAFNRGDGRDVIRGESAATLSLGGGIRYDQLALRRSGADLIVEVGANERITLQEWYAPTPKTSVLNLQVIAEVMAGYDPLSSNTLLDDKVELFDFGKLVDRFDAARAAQPTLGRWMMMNALLDAHLGGSDGAALGGDLAYQYGLNGALTGIGLAAAREIVGSASFGSATQTLLAPQALAEGAIKLA